ncbi:uncharacterized protein LOC129217942 [Uloborus diversus]|uniref:uncharacterized protein LOC129217942 n=1 Tax=Uloborus diversus TaxID=327109 RepID=UPI00240A2B42|nr:uncharacterized protein LOC129217942 [Uloborus diversus]
MSCEPKTLPADRIEDCAVFQVVGIDLAGPLFLKFGLKVWIVLFTCAVYRAIHLELVSSLSTETFLLALRRFISRRGRPRTIYSDNGTNFRGAFNEFSNLDWEKIQRESNTLRIFWKFIPPTAAWWGGWWERFVRLVKELLRCTLENSVLSYEELETVLCECEAVINSRPLTYAGENSQDLIPLTPSMFLTENRSSDVRDLDEIDSKHLVKRIRYRAKLLGDLKGRFRREYLSQLVQKSKQNESSKKTRIK